MSRQKQVTLLAKERRHLKAAQRSLELGNWKTANAELAKIPASNRLNPDVLQAQWTISCMKEDWKGALNTAKRISKIIPEDPFGLCSMAYALHHMKRTQEALTLELAITERFPDHYFVLYNSAYYACRMGKLQEAKALIERAFKSYAKLKLPTKDLRKLALADPDMEPLWGFIRRI
jgi:tetratricopeptide (TPR) repeat protein